MSFSAESAFDTKVLPNLQRRLAAAGVVWETEMAGLRPHLFSPHQVDVAPSTCQQMAEIIQAIEAVLALPAWRETVLAWANPLARVPQASPSVFMGYDFHLTPAGAKLIEINTNAGGGLLAANLLAAYAEVEGETAGETVINTYVAMFQREWDIWQRARQNTREAHALRPLRYLAIVDSEPAAQYLAPEFALFRTLFAAQGWQVVIADPSELVWDGQALRYRGAPDLPLDLVYNRLTDFAFTDASSAALRAAYLANAVLVTPHPYAYALAADKRNLSYLANPTFLAQIGVDAPTRAILAAGIPRTVAVQPDFAEQFWAERRQWFFKPASGFGSRATYRGDKLTKRVFSEILAGEYIAQEIVPPSECTVRNRNNDTNAAEERLKIDVRNYVYAGEVQLLAARLYQGQTTNFRTPGGGFARVLSSNEAN